MSLSQSKPALEQHDQLTQVYRTIRSQTETICQPLELEDHLVQTIDDVSPPKWHLAHTTWFFEQIILSKFSPDYQPFDSDFFFLFNSYYKGFGDHLDRSARGTLSRPTTDAIYKYRHEIDRRVVKLLTNLPKSIAQQVISLVELGLNHEQQHQELLVTDIKHILYSSPLKPAYRSEAKPIEIVTPITLKYISVAGGLIEIGANETSFSYDNERPKHKFYLEDFKIANRLITNGEYLDFINDKAYQNPDLWLSDAWALLSETGWRSPLYWHQDSDSEWQQFTLNGLKPVNLFEPVSHVSYYEAAAFARWSDKRLPTEAEWERASDISKLNSKANFVESESFHPDATISSDQNSNSELFQMAGDLWEWTNSAYLPYPGYKQERGVLGEYNGKFMSGQMVLRGGSCATAEPHYRNTYRNFFQPEKRWQFTGIRLAEDASHRL